MNISLNGLSLTKSFEGCKLVTYQDQRGVWTIGYGHTRGVKSGDTCTQEQADAWLLADMAKAEEGVNAFVTGAMNQNQFDALVDFAFNLGVSAFARSTLLRLFNQGQIAAAADQFSKWDHVGGVESPGLLRRRLAEHDLFMEAE